jgi:branched-chain amino acid transport system permease protein
MADFITTLSSGLTEAAIITLVALGFLMIYKATNVVNFAQGDLVTLAAYLSFWGLRDRGWSFALTYAVVVAAMFVAGVALERLAYAPIRHHSVHVAVVSTLGAALAIRSLITSWKGPAPVLVPGPFKFDGWHVAGAVVPYQNILVVTVAAACVAALMLTFNHTAFGRQVRALASDSGAARLQGIRVARMSMLTFGLAAAMSGIAGVLIAPTQSTTPNLGFSPMLYAFAAAILGGFGRLGGVLIGAVTIGLVHAFATVYLLPDWRLGDLYPFLLMLLVISFRPTGLFGEEAGRRV